MTSREPGGEVTRDLTLVLGKGGGGHGGVDQPSSISPQRAARVAQIQTHTLTVQFAVCDGAVVLESVVSGRRCV